MGESLGEVHLDINHIRKKGQILNHWLPLAGCKSGEIQVSTQYVRTGMKDTFGLEEDKQIDEQELKMSKTKVKKQTKETKEQTPTGKLYIKVRKARSLAKKPLGYPDPYVTLRRRGKIERSETVKNDQNPEWDFAVEYPTFGSAGETTVLEVFDKDVGRVDFLGKVELLDEDIIKYKTVINKWIPLQKCKTGEVQISSQYVDLKESFESVIDLNRLEQDQEALEEKERLEKEREALCRFVPAEILQGLPPEFAELLKTEVGKARENLLTEDPTKGEDGKTKEAVTEEQSEVPVPNNDLNEILGMVDGLDEASSKYIYEQLQTIFKEIEEEDRETKLANLKGELLNLLEEQDKLMPRLPDEISSNVPEEMARQMEEAMKDAYQKLAEREAEKRQISKTTTEQVTVVSDNQKQEEVKEMVTEFLNEDPANSETNDNRDKHDEVKDMITEFLESSDEETEDAVPALPEELLRNLPPEMAESLKRNYGQSMRDIARKEIQKIDQTISKTDLKIQTDVSKSVREKEKEDEQVATSKKPEDVDDEEDMSLPPTPAVTTPWSEIAARPQRPSGPTPAKSEEHERKNSGPFSSLARRELFADERDPSSASPEIIDAANKTVTKVIDEAKEKVIQMTNESASTTKIEQFEEVSVSVDRSTTEEDIFIRDQTISNSEGKKIERNENSNESAREAPVLNWRDTNDGATGLKEKLQGERNNKETTRKMIYTGKLQINVIKAEDLEKLDVLQKADPYVNVKYGSEVSKSEKKKNTLTPEWNHRVDLNLEGESLDEIEIEVMDWERLGKDEPMGRVALPLEVSVDKSSEGGFWLDLKDCKSGRLMVATGFSGTKTQRTVTMRVTENAGAESIPKDKANTNQHKDMKVEEQLPVHPVHKVDQTESNPTVSDDDDGAQALKSLLLKDQTEGADKKETPKEKNSKEDKIDAAENQKNDQGDEEGFETDMLANESEKKVKASNSDVIEVAKSTVTKVIIDAQRKVSETTSNKTTKESEAKGTSAEDMNAEAGKTKEEVHLDWKDDKDGAQGLKTLLKDGKEEEEKRENKIEVIPVATATVTKVIEEEKKKVAETSSGKSITSEEKQEVTTEKDKTS